MRLLLLLLIIVWVHLGDIGTAWLYDGGAVPAAGLLRNGRDLLVIVLASCCLLTVRMSSRLLMLLLAYCAMAVLYLLLNRANVALGILIGSFGTLVIPILFFLTGFYCVRQRHQLHTCIALMVIIALASVVFSAWERQHTDFWIDTLNFPSYMLNVKGLLIGANPETGLPWNFYANMDLDRRAAGLLASPLAQGMFLAIVAVVVVARFEHRARGFGLMLCSFFLAGIWMTGTRGAMLAACVALVGYLLSATKLFRSRLARLLVVSGACMLIMLASYNIVMASLELVDGSTVGHWMALKKNLQDLPKALLLGPGLGQQGAIAAQQGQASIGGGEGAIFSIAFQLGLPAALLFLAFYVQLAQSLWCGYQRQRDPMSLAMFWLLLGIAPTLISSEHVLAVSGTGAFWLLCGATLRSLPPPPLCCRDML